MLSKWKDLLQSCREVKKFLRDEVRSRLLNLQLLLEECEWDTTLEFKHAVYTPGEGWEYDPLKVDILQIEQEVIKLVEQRVNKLWDNYDKLVKKVDVKG